jgi:hypothetical protein
METTSLAMCAGLQQKNRQLTNGVSTMANVTKPISLGELQSVFEHSRKEFASASKGLTKAQDEHDRAKKAYDAAYAALKEATRTVLG